MPTIQECSAAELFEEICRRGLMQSILGRVAAPDLVANVRARPAGLLGATHLLTLRELRGFAERRMIEGASAVAPSGPWDSERDRMRSIERAAESFAEPGAVVMLGTECAPDEVDTEVRRCIESLTEEYGVDSGEEDAPPVRDRETGALPGGADGTEWSTTE